MDPETSHKHKTRRDKDAISNQRVHTRAVSEYNYEVQEISQLEYEGQSSKYYHTQKSEKHFQETKIQKLQQINSNIDDQSLIKKKGMDPGTAHTNCKTTQQDCTINLGVHPKALDKKMYEYLDDRIDITNNYISLFVEKILKKHEEISRLTDTIRLIQRKHFHNQDSKDMVISVKEEDLLKYEQELQQDLAKMIKKLKLQNVNEDQLRSFIVEQLALSSDKIGNDEPNFTYEIDAVKQHKFWDQYTDQYKYKNHSFIIDPLVGVYMEYNYHELEQAFVKKHLDAAIKEMWKYQQYFDYYARNHTLIYDICCGAGRCVPLYAQAFPLGVCLHDQNITFLEQADHEVSLQLSDPNNGYIKKAFFKCSKRLDKIEFPENKVQFIFANFAFENLRDDQLESTIKKCIDNLSYGGIIFIKEPHPTQSKTVAEYHEDQQRHLRPKSEYKNLLTENGCVKVTEITENFRFKPGDYGPEFILIYRKTNRFNQKKSCNYQ